MIRAGYALLDLITFLTAGPKEARAWTITRGTKAPQAARVIRGYGDSLLGYGDSSLNWVTVSAG